MREPAPEISVVVPVYRNADTLQTLHTTLCDVLAGCGEPFEIVYVDDACPDGSAGVLERVTAADGRAVALLLAKNVGQSRAVLAGLAHARGRWVVVMDADLQDPPEAIPALLEAARAGYEVVFAGRRGRYESASRRATSALFKRVMHRIAGLPNDAGLFVVLDRAVVNRVLGMRVRRPYVVGLISASGAHWTSVPVARAARPRGQSAYSLARRLTVGLDGLWSAITARGCSVGNPGERPEGNVEIRARLGARWRRGRSHASPGAREAERHE